MPVDAAWQPDGLCGDAVLPDGGVDVVPQVRRAIHAACGMPGTFAGVCPVCGVAGGRAAEQACACELREARLLMGVLVFDGVRAEMGRMLMGPELFETMACRWVAGLVMCGGACKLPEAGCCGACEAELAMLAELMETVKQLTAEEAAAVLQGAFERRASVVMPEMFRRWADYLEGGGSMTVAYAEMRRAFGALEGG